MYFFLKRGKQQMDLRGDFVLTHNKELISTRSKSSGPRTAINATYIKDIRAMGFFGKLKTCCHAIDFIFSKEKNDKPS